MLVILNNVNDKVASIDVDINKRIINSVKIVKGKEKMAKIYFPKINDNPKYQDLEKLIKFYLDDTTDIKLSEHLNAIKYGLLQFKTQYKRNLTIEVQD